MKKLLSLLLSIMIIVTSVIIPSVISASAEDDAENHRMQLAHPRRS